MRRLYFPDAAPRVEPIPLTVALPSIGAAAPVGAASDAARPPRR